ncbi:FtsK/SpoIIIE domain-containing protein [Tsukamurella hominis]|uniref:FtsK/SpoIIIE domain-containing protein n=1 Tax=Tsukamurella hominis TaxID=1970232 RepID=UPI0039E76CAA
MVRENKIDRRVKEMRREDPSLKLSVARRLAQAEQDARVDEAAAPRLDAALGITGPVSSWAPRATWAANERDVLVRIPLGPERDHGQTAAGAVVDVAIGDPRHGGDGNGALLGRANSGKSVLMREMVLAAAAKYSPDRITFALVSFDEDWTFRDLDTLPHTLVHVAEGGDAVDQVARMWEIVEGELNRRRQLLSDWDVDTAVEYRAKRGEDLDRRNGTSAMPALPDLLLVADEFGSYTSVSPGYLELFEAIGSTGADVGVYMLLSSHTLSGHRAQGLMEHIGFGIAKRVSLAADSRLLLGTAEALWLSGAISGSIPVTRSSGSRIAGTA